MRAVVACGGERFGAGKVTSLSIPVAGEHFHFPAPFSLCLPVFSFDMSGSQLLLLILCSYLFY